jgi:hypothetical protein
MEDARGGLVDAALHRLQDVGEPLDHGVQQAEQRHGPATGVTLRDTLGVQAEGLQLRIAQSDQPAVGQHEGDRRGFRRLVLTPGEERGGHESRAVLLVEPAGGLDLGHFGERRQLQAKRGLDGEFLLARRLEQVDPDDVGIEPPARVGRLGLERARALVEHSQHAASVSRS